MRLHALLLTALALSLPSAVSAAESDTGAGALPPDMPARLEACAGCHGEGGRSDAETYYPSIAGKPAGYLHAQLVNFRIGRRHHAVMRTMLAYLSDEYLQEIARFYASETPTRSPPLTGIAAGTLALGRKLVEEGDPARELVACAACHDATLAGVAPAVPGLLGLRAEYLSGQLGAFRMGVRRAAEPNCMARIAKALTPAEIHAVSAFIASRPYPEQLRPATDAPDEWPMPCGGVP